MSYVIKKYSRGAAKVQESKKLWRTLISILTAGDTSFAGKVLSHEALLFILKFWLETNVTEKNSKTEAKANNSEGPPSYQQNSKFGVKIVEDFHFHSDDSKTAAKEI